MSIRAILSLSTAMTLVLGATSAIAAEQPTAAGAAQAESASSAGRDASAAQSDRAAAAPASSAAAQGGSATSLQEIVVTAQRRSENLQKAAIAITAVAGDAIVRAGVGDTAQLTRIAPSLQIGTLAGPQSEFYLRGVGNFTANSLSDAAVSVNIDGVPIVRSNAIQGLFYDLERIEVLKGPQGTLYGRNATGGAINLISAKPHLGEYSGYLNVEYGNFDALKLSSALNIPIGENTAVRIAGIVSDHDGYYTDGTGDDKTRAVRVQVTSQPTDTFKVTGGFDYTHVGGKGSGSTLFGLDRDKYIGQSDPRAVALWQQTFSVPAAAFMAGVPNDQFQDNNYYGVYAQADWETPVGTLTVIPAYRNTDARYRIHASSVSVNERLRDYQTTVEARLASDSTKRFTYLFGGFFLDEKARERPGFGEQFFSAFGQFSTETKSYAGFGRLTFKVTDKFRLTGGARYTEDHKSGLIAADNVIVICPSFFAGGLPGTGPACIGTPVLPNTFDVPSVFLQPNGDPVPVQPWGTNGAIVTNSRVINTPSKTFTKVTYHAGVEYDVAPQSLLYANYDTGFKSGGFFNSIDNPVYQPETITAYTVGLKNRFFDNRVQLNIEAFWWAYRDQQVSHFRLNSAGASEFVTENVGRTRIRGIEVEGKALVAQGATLSATVQYLDPIYKNFVYANPAANGPPTTGCLVTFDPVHKDTPTSAPSPANVIDCGGRQVVNAPKWTINAGVEKVFDIANGGRVVLNADGRYQSSAFTGFEQLPQQRQKGYFTLDLQAQYELPGNHMTIAGFANNVTNKAAVGFSSPHPFGPSLVALALRPPRTYGVRVGYKF